MKRGLFLLHIKEDQMWAGHGLQGSLTGLLLAYPSVGHVASTTKVSTQGTADTFAFWPVGVREEETGLWTLMLPPERY